MHITLLMLQYPVLQAPHPPIRSCPQYEFQISKTWKQIKPKGWLDVRMVQEVKEITSMFLALFYMTKQYPAKRYCYNPEMFCSSFLCLEMLSWKYCISKP